MENRDNTFAKTNSLLFHPTGAAVGGTANATNRFAACLGLRPTTKLSTATMRIKIIDSLRKRILENHHRESRTRNRDRVSPDDQLPALSNVST